MTEAEIREVRVALGDGFTTSLAIQDGLARWCVGSATVAEATLDQLLAAWTMTIGKPVRVWHECFQKADLQIDLPDYSAQHANGIKALALLCVWIEPAIRRGTGLADAGALCDEVIIDYTGAPGQQPYIYLLAERQQQDTPAHAGLFALGLLAKLTLHGQSEKRRWFKPLVTPFIRVDQLGVAERLWVRTKDDMRAAVQRAAGGQR
jgi:hypothetical protein